MKLKHIRNKKRITQEQLAAMSGVDQSTISALENGTRTRPSWEIVSKLARALDVAPEELFPVKTNNDAA